MSGDSIQNPPEFRIIQILNGEMILNPFLAACGLFGAFENTEECLRLFGLR